MTKRYYWIKLKDSFFNQLVIKKLRRIAGGDTYVIIYLKMMLLSMNEGGKICYECEDNDFCSNLSIDIDEDLEDVKMTLAFLNSNKLLEYTHDGGAFLPDVPKCLGSETEWAEKKRRYRKSIENSDKTRTLSSSCPSDVRQEIDIDKEKNTTTMVGVNAQADFLSKLIGFWDNNFHPVTPHESELIRGLLDDVGYSNVIQAMEIAVSNNRRNFGYVKSTADNLANGIDFREKNKPKEEPKEEYHTVLTDKEKAFYEKWKAEHGEGNG